jgi:hypothetical protein
MPLIQILARILSLMQCVFHLRDYRHLFCRPSARCRSILRRSVRRSPPRFDVILHSSAIKSPREPESPPFSPFERPQYYRKY